MQPAAGRSIEMRRGIWMFPGIGAAALVDAVVAAEELGLDEVWIADEGVAREPIPVLSAAAVQTRRIRLATGITTPVLRHPGALASTVSTLDELSDGRAMLGLGVGGHLTLEPFGLEADRPVGRMREAIELIRAVHSGRTIEAYRPPEHAAPPREVPIWVGARGPQLVRLAARAADGLFLSGCTPEQHETIADQASEVGDVALAIYQTAVDVPSSSNELGWDAAIDALRRAVGEHRPASIGLNLVQLATPGTDPILLVQRAADLLSAV